MCIDRYTCVCIYMYMYRHMHNGILFGHEKEANPTTWAIWMDLDGITLSEMSDSGRHCDHTFM